MNEDRLRQHLADKAASVEVAPGNPDDLKARSTNPLLLMGAGLGLVTLFGLGLAWLLPASDGDLVASDTTIADSGIVDSGVLESTTVRPSGAGSSLPAIAASAGPSLSWQSGGDFAAGSWVSGIIAYQDGFLAWGQVAPDEFGEDLVDVELRSTFLVWTSTDGLNWTEVATEGLNNADDFWINTVLATDERLIAVGMAWDPPVDPASSRYEPGNERMILLTSADGAVWESTDLGPQLAGSTDTPGEFWSSGQPMLASNGDVVVLLNTQTLSFDPYIILEERLGSDGVEIFGFDTDSESGVIDVYGPGEDGNEEVIASYTAADLGIDPDILASGGGPRETRFFAHLSTDGGATFEAVTASGVEGIGYLNGIVTTADGFVVSAEEVFDSESRFAPSQASWTSRDGVNWTKGAPLADGWFNNLDSYGDFIVGVGDNLVVSFDAGATFSRVEGPVFEPVGDLEFYVEQAETGAFGTIAVGSAWRPGPPPPPLVVEVDGLVYTEEYLEDFNQGGPTVTVTDAATGEVLFDRDNFWQPEYITYGTEGDEFLTFVSPETGEPLMEVSWQELEVEPFGSDSAIIERDGLRFSIDYGDGEERMPHVVITDVASGDVVFDVDNVFSPSYVRQDDDGFTILDDAGADIMRLAYDDMDRAYESFEEDAEYEEPIMALWFSPDGTAWSRQSMEEAFGDSGYVQAVVSGSDRVVVTFQPHDQFSPQSEEEARTYIPPATQVWVGTLP